MPSTYRVPKLFLSLVFFLIGRVLVVMTAEINHGCFFCKSDPGRRSVVVVGGGAGAAAVVVVAAIIVILSFETLLLSIRALQAVANGPIDARSSKGLSSPDSFLALVVVHSVLLIKLSATVGYVLCTVWEVDC